jgi:hypothetical protein
MAKFHELAESDDFKGLTAVRDVGVSPVSLATATSLLTNRQMSKYRFGVALEEAATTTDFPILLGTIFEQELIQQYQNTDLDWKQYIRTGSQGDFRPKNLVNTHGLTKPLFEVAEHGEYKYGSMVESKVQTRLKKYGKLFGITMEDIINDRYGVFRDLATPLAKAAQKTEFRLATGTFVTATGPNPKLFGNAVVNPIDGVVINNLMNEDLNSDSLQRAIAKLRNQRDADGDPILFNTVHVVVPPALEFRLWSIISPSTQIALAPGTTAANKATPTVVTSENMIRKYTIIPHTNAYMPLLDMSGNADKTWYVFIDPSEVVAAQVQYLSGYETPQVMVKASNQLNAGGGSAGPESFENDTQEWKVRHFLGDAYVDARGAVASVAP